MKDTPEVIEHLKKKPEHLNPSTSTQAERDEWREAFIKWDKELTSLRIGSIKHTLNLKPNVVKFLGSAKE